MCVTDYFQNFRVSYIFFSRNFFLNKTFYFVSRILSMKIKEILLKENKEILIFFLKFERYIKANISMKGNGMICV